MDKKDLKSATRKELMELLIEVYEENNMLREQNEELKEKVEKQTLVICEKDDLAEIEIKITGVFEVIEQAKKKYLKNRKFLEHAKEK